MSKTKGGGSTRNGRDSNAQRLGVKVYDGQVITAGSIIVRPVCSAWVPLPTPKYQQGERLPASYCNFYVANGIVVLPVFDDSADQRAVDTIQSFWPDRQVVPMLATDLAWGLGAFHCLTQQQPAS